MATRHLLPEFEGFLNRLTKIDETVINRFLKGQCSDALSYAGTANPVTVKSYERIRAIADYLTHIPVNPHNALTSRLICDSYVLGANIEKKASFVNKNEFSIARFVFSLVQCATHERQLSVESRATNRSMDALVSNNVFILHGETGVGKTFSLNYTLTRFHEMLDRRKVIWVRINLVYKSTFDDDILGWIRAQTAKIVLRYYDKESRVSPKKVVDVISHLKTWIAENENFDDEVKVEKNRKLRIMQQVWCTGASDEHIRPQNSDEEICTEIYRHLREEGWSFVVVLDGFDRLDIMPEESHRFNIVRRGIEEIISMRSVFGACILIVSRTYTIDALLSIDPFRKISDKNKYTIGLVEFSKIASARFDAIRSFARRSLPSWGDFHDRDETSRTFDNFVLSLSSPDNKLLEIDENFAENNRAKLQALQLIFLDYVNWKTGKAYVVIEHTMKNGRKYPAIAYEYVDARTMTARITREIAFDSRFLPILTRFPRLTKPSGQWSDLGAKEACHFLIGIRILQLLLSVEADQSLEAPSLGQILNILHFGFGVEKKIAAAEVYELEGFELLRIGRDATTPIESENNPVISLPKSRYMVERYLGDIAFLNMCAMRTLLPTRVFELGLIDLCALSGGRDSLIPWLRTKISNAFSLHALMSMANQLQRAEYSKRDRSKLSRHEERMLRVTRDRGLWSLIPTKVQKLTQDMNNILYATSYTGFTHRPNLSNEEREQIVEEVRNMYRTLIEKTG